MEIKEYRIRFDEKQHRNILDGEPLQMVTDEVIGTYIEKTEYMARFGTPTEHYLIKHRYVSQLIDNEEIKKGNTYKIIGNANGLLRVYKYNAKYDDYMRINAQPADLKGVTKRDNKYGVYQHKNGRPVAYGTTDTLENAIIYNKYLHSRGHPKQCITHRVGAAHRTRQLNHIINTNIFETDQTIYKQLDDYFNGNLWPSMQEMKDAETTTKTIAQEIKEIKTRLDKIEKTLNDVLL